MDDQALDRLFSGDLNKLVDLPKRLVRLFISSTFTDMTLERNSLMERVYPRLKKYCREKHGLDFQVVDMRWGVRDEATDDHQTSTLCSKEIDNCQRMSLGPNFVALLGDKYGFRPLCNRIKSSEYRALRRCLIELDINTDFLDTWYKEDLNAVPAEYLLQPISSILKNFTNKKEPELQAIDQRIWQAIQERLHELLMISSSRLVKQGRMNEQEQLTKYSISVTEREVIEGCLEVNEAKAHCLVYIRSIHDLKTHLNKCLSNYSLFANATQQKQQRLDSSSSVGGDSITTTHSASSTTSDNNNRRDSQASRKASLKIGEDSISLTTSLAQTSTERKIEKTRKLIGKYIDLISKDNVWNIDKEAQEALSYLKDVKLESKLKVNGRNLNKFKISWNEMEGVSLKSEEHKYYLNELTEHFFNNITRMIRKASKNQQELKSGLVGEILQHSHYAKHVSKTFHGRSEELSKIKEYILSSIYSSYEDNDEDTMPMFIYGVGGSGKTSTLAKAATLAKNWYLEAKNQIQLAGGEVDVNAWNQQPCIIMRFCCTTPNSSSIVGVLTSVCRQLQYNFYQFGPLNGHENNEYKRMEKIPSSSEESSRRVQSQLPFQSIPEDFVRLVFTFRQLLDNCQHELHRQRLFLIIIDSVERLSSPAESSVELKYSWLTSIVRLPANVRLIISCSSEKTSENWNLDYIHLKRHFLQSFYNNLNYNHQQQHSNGNDEDNDYEQENQSDNLQLLVEPNETIDTRDLNEKELFRDDIVSSDKTDERYRYLKQILIPSVKFMKVLKNKRRDNYNNDEDVSGQKAQGSSLIPQNRWSLSSKKRKLNNLSLTTTTTNLITNELSINSSEKIHLVDSPLTALVSSSSNNNNQAQFLISKKKDSENSRKLQKASLKTIWMIHIKPLGVNLALKVAQRWLSDVGRNLTIQQWSIVENSFKHCSRPIFVKLAFGEIVNWKSYSMQSDSKGLTFGSSLLLDENGEISQKANKLLSNFPLSIKKSVNKVFNEHLLRLKIESEAGNAIGGICFTNEILTMEQQWLNYLEYKQRLQEQESMINNSQQENNSVQDNSSSSVVIRVGGSASMSKTTLATSGGSNNNNKVTNKQTNNSNLLSTSSICHLSNTIDDAICQLFARIELQHGYVLTKHSLSYITAARNGICENELEDILSLDDVVLDDVFQYHLPPVRRIPPLLWTRIRNDLPDYLSERDADGIVINWHHSEFKYVTQQRYLSDKKQLYYIHSLLADYFLGKWADKPKPFRCTKQQIQMAADQLESAVQQSIRDSQAFTTTTTTTGGNNARSSISGGPSRLYGGGSTGGAGGSRAAAGASFSVRSRLRSSDQQDSRLKWMQAKADRRVPHQPLFYLKEQKQDSSLSASASDINNNIKSNDKGTINTKEVYSYINRTTTITSKRFNMRKLTEMPYHLMRSRRFLDLANHVLFNYKWLSSASEASGLQNLLADFQEADYYLRIALNEAIKNDNINSPTPSPVNNNNTGSINASSMILIDQDGITLADELDVETLKSIVNQLNILTNTIRLSCSSIHSDTQMLAPQLIGRLLPIVKQANRTTNIRLRNEFKYLIQLLEQCYTIGCSDIALLPIDHCLQSPDGLQLSSLEGHSFAIMSMSIASDQRHLLAISNRFIMWDISTGEISRDIDPKIEGSIMKELKIGSNNEYAIVYTSDNIILVLDILTQQVSKFDLLPIKNAKQSKGFHFHDDESDEVDDDIIGLNLIDKSGATSFIVWTKKQFFVMRVINIEKCRNNDKKNSPTNNSNHKNGRTSSRISIELVYGLDLGVELKRNGCDDGTSNAFGQIINVQQDSNHEGLTFIETTFDKSNKSQLESNSFCVQLITMKISADGKDYKLWKGKLLSSSLSIDSSNLKQLVYSDRLGNVFLSRRRVSCWSKAKLIYSIASDNNQNHHSTEISFMNQLNSILQSGNNINITSHSNSFKPQVPMKLLAIESVSSLNDSWFNQNDLFDQDRLISLANFEKSIDSLSLNDEIEDNCVYNKPAHNSSNLLLLPNSKRRDFGRRLMKNLNPIKYIKLYLSDKIVIIRLENKRNKIRNLLFPKNVRNISVELNKCQINSILIGNEELDEQLFLVAAVGRKLLIYNVLREQFLKTIDAHNGRIVQIIPIYNMNKKVKTNKDNNNNQQQQQQLAVASASMDKTVKIWNLLNVDKDLYNLDKMVSSIETICISKQRPLTGCIARGELALWDWRTLKLISKISLPDLLLSKNNNYNDTEDQVEEQYETNSSSVGSKPQNLNRKTRDGEEIASKIVKCCFSSNGRYLFLATLDSICLLTIESSTANSPSAKISSQAPSLSTTTNDGLNFKLSFRHHLFKNSSTPSTNSTVVVQADNSKAGNSSLLAGEIRSKNNPTAIARRLTFFLQDSRVLTVLECNSFNINNSFVRNSETTTTTTTPSPHQPKANRASSSNDTRRRLSSFDQTSEQTTTATTSSAENNFRLSSRLILLCHSVPDGRLIYKIECLTPISTGTSTNTTTTANNYSTSTQSDPLGRRSKSISLEGQSSSASRADETLAPSETKANSRIKLPVLTRDQLHIVTVESFNGTSVNDNAGEHYSRRRKSGSIMTRNIPVSLNIYSARDGLLIRTINLAQLELWSSPQPQNIISNSLQAATTPAGNNNDHNNGGRKQTADKAKLSILNGNNVAVTVSVGGQQADKPHALISPNPSSPNNNNNNNNDSNSNSNNKVLFSSSNSSIQQIVSIGNEQFTRIKAITYRERQSVVALLDDEQGFSYLIDVQTKQLMASSSVWNGKISSDGRYGLSRMFKTTTTFNVSSSTAATNKNKQQQQQLALANNTADQLSSVSATRSDNNNSTTAASSSNIASSSGLQLLEMSHFTSVKSLLTNEMRTKLSKLASSQASTGTDTDVTCGFTKPNDSYVYYYDSRLSRLLLIRLRDGELIANYKLSSLVTKIKSSNDGYALILAHADGSLTSLAIVDPQKNDTLLKLAQYPSRSKS